MFLRFKRRVAIWLCAAQLSPVYTFYLHKHVILLRIEAPDQLNPLGPAAIYEYPYTLVALVKSMLYIIINAINVYISLLLSSSIVFLENWPFRIKAIMLFLPCTFC